jgi:hypothetical protein
MGRRHSVGEIPLRLWVENAHQSLAGARPAQEEVCGDVVRTLQTEEQFLAILVSSPQGGADGTAKVTLIADRAASMLEQGTSLDTVVDNILDVVPSGEYASFSILEVLGGCEAQVVECDAPPLFLIRGGQVVLLPVLEGISHGHLTRECRFLLRDGDHMAMVSEGFVRARGWGGRWGWRDIAISTRRWTDTGCDAEQLLGALIRTYRRLAEGQFDRDVAVIAMHIRPMRTATIWTGPPVDPAQDQIVLERLMAEPGLRVICGDTSAQIAARLLGSELEIERRPPDGWAEVPPVARLEGVDLVTEGRITLDKASERLAAAREARHPPRTEDGATRLARVLLSADIVHFIVGLAMNPQQTADVAGVPLRQAVVEELMRDLRARRKVVFVEYF